MRTEGPRPPRGCFGNLCCRWSREGAWSQLAHWEWACLAALERQALEGQLCVWTGCRKVLEKAGAWSPLGRSLLSAAEELSRGS